MPTISARLADQSSFAFPDTLQVGWFATPLAADGRRFYYPSSHKAAGAIAEAERATSGGCAVPSGCGRRFHFSSLPAANLNSSWRIRP